MVTPSYPYDFVKNHHHLNKLPDSQIGLAMDSSQIDTVNTSSLTTFLVNDDGIQERNILYSFSLKPELWRNYFFLAFSRNILHIRFEEKR